jgi:enamine deaminase RidA (YjgF/YER057c/UK114 family)
VSASGSSLESPEDRIAAAGLALPNTAAPLATYVPAIRDGDHVWTSGQLPTIDGTLLARGKVGTDVSQEQAIACARQCALNALAAIRDLVGDLSAVRQVVKVVVYVASDPGFTGQPAVANGVSELLVEIFGDVGKHARSAVGVAVLPLDAPVEAEVVVRVGRDSA